MALAGRRANARIVLILAVSLFFYGWWDWRFVPLLLGSIAVNYVLGGRLQRCVSDGRQRAADVALTVGVVFDLLVLGVLKYLQFVLGNIDAVTGANWTIIHLVLPLGISFWTFEQISYLVDLRRGLHFRRNPLH